MSLLTEFIQPLLTSPWLLFGLPVLLLFYINYKALSSYQQHPEPYAFVITCLREDEFSELYHRLLGAMLDKVSNWIGDKKQYESRAIAATRSGEKSILVACRHFFSAYPFSAPSYEAVLRLAFIYPIVLYLVLWSMGGDGGMTGKAFAGYTMQLYFPVEQRWPLFYLAVSAAILGGLLIKQCIKKQILMLSGLSLLAFGLGFANELKLFWTLFFWLFLATYTGGRVIARLLKNNNTIAHKRIHPFAIAFTVTFAVAIVIFSALSAMPDTDSVFSVRFDLGHTSPNMLIAVAITIIAIATIAATDAITSSAAAVAITVGHVAIAAGATVIHGCTGNIVYIDYVTTSAAAAVTGVIYILLSSLQQQCKKNASLLLFWIFYSLAVLLISYSLINWAEMWSFLLLYLIFSLLNAPLDWLSLNITRGLLQNIHHQQHSGWQTFIWALFDLLLALIFLLLVSAVLLLTISYTDSLLGSPNLQVVLKEIAQPDSVKNYYWIFLALSRNGN